MTAAPIWPASGFRETEDLTRKPRRHNSRQRAYLVLTGAPTTTSPRDWFAGAEDNRDHSTRSDRR
jgi:hypothetical protein